ncbi:WASH complex subunit 3 [Episyrphus balteatus]|uniref:WASH complex subunit 3 n=1 Tax=Episyrphus balteatus TaxID=286459 RepID=UPI0024859052|nr:WASH complex subunit 3 [Episyrphus balteatus]
MNENILQNSIDKTQIPPLHQKRILAFVNHFVISSCSFLNDFASKCETKFIEVERKMQKVEASLIIIESKLSSIPNQIEPKQKVELDSSPSAGQEVHEEKKVDNVPSVAEENDTIEQVPSPPLEETGVKACEDERYKRFFKMLQFGVPIAAVKLKMKAEGVDPDIIDTPNLLLTDGITAS